jgi:hypothetical protein
MNRRNTLLTAAVVALLATAACGGNAGKPAAEKPRAALTASSAAQTTTSKPADTGPTTSASSGCPSGYAELGCHGNEQLVQPYCLLPPAQIAQLLGYHSGSLVADEVSVPGCSYVSPVANGSQEINWDTLAVYELSSSWSSWINVHQRTRLSGFPKGSKGYAALVSGEPRVVFRLQRQHISGSCANLNEGPTAEQLASDNARLCNVYARALLKHFPATG